MSAPNREPTGASALRYVRWIDRHKYAVLALSLLLAVLSGYVDSGLPLRSEFSNLLPPERQSARDLNELKKRIRTFGTVFVVVDGENAEAVTAASYGAHLLLGDFAAGLRLGAVIVTLALVEYLALMQIAGIRLGRKAAATKP